MKNIISSLLIIAIAYFFFNHIEKLENSNTQIDQLEAGLSTFSKYLEGGSAISFLANSPEEVKIHFETQNILAPIVVHKGWQDHDYLLYIEDYNHPANEGVPTSFFTLVDSVRDDRFHFKLFKRK